MLELHVIFCGRVQGVGFRWTIVDHAEKHHLTGTVQNLPDESVEVFAQGSQADLEAFLASVQTDPGNATIKSINTNFLQPTFSLTTFRIIQE